MSRTVVVVVWALGMVAIAWSCIHLLGVAL